MAIKVLIIDDDPGDRELIREALIKLGAGCEVFTADGGEDGIKMAQDVRPYIVLVDTVMPDFNGFQTCKHIKGIEGLDAKVIVMTGNVDAVDASTAQTMGADDYCVKTADCVPIIEAVKKVGL